MRILNATVNDGALQKALLDQKYHSGDGVREFVAQSWCKPGSTKKIVNHLPPQEEYQADGSTVTKKVKTSTVRKSH